MKTITKSEQISFLRKMLTTNRAWAERAVVRIFQAQTSDEQVTFSVSHHNGVGFTSVDAEYLTSCARTVLCRGHVTDKQLPYLFKKIGKYATQLFSEGYFDHQKLINLIEKTNEKNEENKKDN